MGGPLEGGIEFCQLSTAAGAMMFLDFYAKKNRFFPSAKFVRWGGGILGSRVGDP